MVFFLKTMADAKEIKEEKNNSSQECSICYSIPDVSLPGCNHWFCEGCIRKCFRAGIETCPNCRCRFSTILVNGGNEVALNKVYQVPTALPATKIYWFGWIKLMEDRFRERAGLPEGVCVNELVVNIPVENIREAALRLRQEILDSRNGNPAGVIGIDEVEELSIRMLHKACKRVPGKRAGKRAQEILKTIINLKSRNQPTPPPKINRNPPTEEDEIDGIAGRFLNYYEGKSGRRIQPPRPRPSLRHHAMNREEVGNSEEDDLEDSGEDDQCEYEDAEDDFEDSGEDDQCEYEDAEEDNFEDSGEDDQCEYEDAEEDDFEDSEE